MRTWRATLIGWTGIPIGGATDFLWRLQYSVQVTNVKEGDVYDAYSLEEVRNDAGFNVECVSMLTVHSAWPPTPDYAYTGQNQPDAAPTLLDHTPIMGEDIPVINPNGRHYMIVAPHLTFTATKDYQVVTFGTWVRGRSSFGQTGQLTGMQGQGFLQVNKLCG